MNRIYFFVLTGLSTIVFVLLVAHIFLSHQVGILQAQTQVAQQNLSQAQAIRANLQQLALRIYQDAQKTQDPGLKDIVTREQISFTPSASSPPPAPETPAAPAK